MCDNVSVVLFATLVFACLVFLPMGLLTIKRGGSAKLLKATCCYFFCIACFILVNSLLINQGLIGDEILIIGCGASFIALVLHLTILSDE